MAVTSWTPSSWRNFPAQQQPQFDDPTDLKVAVESLAQLPPLVFAGEARSLLEGLGRVAERKAFLLQAGDCAESFDSCTAQSIRERLRVILQMAVVLTYSAGVPVVKVGRIAGQYAKPRSSNEARQVDPQRLLSAYHYSAATLNLLRAFTKGGFADLSRLHQWNVEFVAQSDAGEKYDSMASEIDRALRFMEAVGLNSAARSAPPPLPSGLSTFARSSTRTVSPVDSP